MIIPDETTLSGVISDFIGDLSYQLQWFNLEKRDIREKRNKDSVKGNRNPLLLTENYFQER